jgi:eukaryotic-like serine/threonine-protein kinase
MKPERWQQVERLFLSALERDPGQRAAFLDQACAGDDELRREIESLLAYEERAESFIETPAIEVEARLLIDPCKSQEAFKGTERFLLQRRLGSGGFGVVYQAYDNERNTVVALKTLNQTNSETLYRFKQEFRALADITHSNLVTLYELMSDGEQWFFTMELVEGIDFLTYVRESSGHDDSFYDAPTIKLKPGKTDRPLQSVNTEEIESKSLTYQLKTDRLRKALKQLAVGISALHQAGRLHRDIKPSNVMVTKEGRVVLLDFGLATEFAPRDLHQSMNIVGTPAYMSPEQAAGLPVGQATDWYSVGVMLYEALTGSLPFTGQALNVLMDKQSFEPPAPGRLVRGIPEDLNGLCEELLRRDPQRRPVGREILRRLAGEQPEAKEPLPVPSPTMATAAPFVGRESHLAALRNAYQLTKKGSALTVYVKGRAGMGKSTLVRHFLEELQMSEKDLVVLTGRCYEQESVPYKALDSVVDALSQYLKCLPLLEVEALMPRDMQALARLFPVLQQVEALAGARRRVIEIPDSQELRRRAFGALRELLARLADRKSLVLFIDDLQWGDVDSAALLYELLRPPDPPVILLIASYRSEDTETSPLLRALLQSSSNSLAAEVRELAVEELSPTESQELALALLGEEEPESVAHAEAIALESRGGPLFVDELVRYSQKDLVLVPHTESGAERDNGKDSGKIRLGEVIQARVSRLSEEARRLLEVVSVAGQPLGRAGAKQAAGLETEEQAALALLRAERLIRVTGRSEEEEIETYHDLIREAVVTRLCPATLLTHHHNLALALEAMGCADPERLALHFHRSGDLEKAAEYSVEAAGQAAGALAFEHAARLYQLALELQPADSERGQMLRVKLADALANAGRGLEAARAYLDAAGDEPSAETIELKRRAAEQYLVSGYNDEGLAVLRTVLGRLGMQLPKTRLRIVLSLLIHRMRLRLRGYEFRERKEAEISAEELLPIDMFWSMGMGFGRSDPIQGFYFLTQHLLLALNAGEPYRIARGLSMEASFLSLIGRRRSTRTERIFRKVESLAERIGHPHALGLAALTAGMAALFEGRWKRALELSESAERILRERCTGISWELQNTQFWSIYSMLFLGEFKKLSDRLPILIKEAQDRGDLFSEAQLRGAVLYYVQLAADQAERARQEQLETYDLWTRQGVASQIYWAGLAEIALYSGEGRTAWDLISEHWSAITRFPLPRIQLIFINLLYLRARCALAACSRTDPDERLLRAAERDARRIERRNVLYGKALAHLIRAGIAANRRDLEKALTLLVSAENGFEAADMALSAAVARRCRGQLIGGEQGQLLIESADNWMAGQKIKNPARMTAMLAPGKWEG